MKKLALLGALLALFSLLGMRDVFSTSGEGIEVETGLVQLGPFNSSILASGQLSYREDVQLRSEIAGRVVEVLVQESDRVSKGQVVVRIDPTQFRKQVEQLQALVGVLIAPNRRPFGRVVDHRRRLLRLRRQRGGQHQCGEREGAHQRASVEAASAALSFS